MTSKSGKRKAEDTSPLAAKSDAGAARLGRPRLNTEFPVEDPREQLLEAAADLFSTVGFNQATTRAIADAAGLQQPSMFHYFRNKRALFAEVLDRTVQPQIDLVERLRTVEAPADVRFYVLVDGDVQSLCSNSFSVPLLQLLPDAEQLGFTDFFAKREQLLQEYVDIIDAGNVEGTIVTDDAERTARIVFGTVESVPSWLRGRQQDAGEVARSVADILVGGLVGLPRLDEVRPLAAALHARITQSDVVVSAPSAPCVDQSPPGHLDLR
jgi:AcrR family transcriptional regulator